MKELGITTGEWQYRDHFSDGIIETEETIIGHLMKWGSPEDELQSNAILIIDAGNTAQKCGLLPSELLRQRDELREALADMVSQFAYRGTYEGRENLHTGGLSALESAFDALGLSDPITLVDFYAAIKNTDG